VTLLVTCIEGKVVHEEGRRGDVELTDKTKQTKPPGVKREGWKEAKISTSRAYLEKGGHTGLGKSLRPTGSTG